MFFICSAIAGGRILNYGGNYGNYGDTLPNPQTELKPCLGKSTLCQHCFVGRGHGMPCPRSRTNGPPPPHNYGELDYVEITVTGDFGNSAERHRNYSPSSPSTPSASGTITSGRFMLKS